MQATVVRNETQKPADEYLGYRIQLQDGSYVAMPLGWNGEVIVAETLPTVRRKIWRWWHQVQ